MWGKQGCGVFQALTMGTNISHTVIFNGPRAGVLWNDGMGGANNLEHSLMFNLVRETTGAFSVALGIASLYRINSTCWLNKSALLWFHDHHRFD